MSEINLKNYWSLDQLEKQKGRIHKVFFIRICGTGMGASACLLREKGLEVAGADTMFYPPMSDYLKNAGIKLLDLNELDWNDLKQYDLIVVGNVVPRGSDLAHKIEELGVPFCSFPAAIGALVLADKCVVGISGTHGKTTTTYLFTQVFRKLGIDAGHFIGGVIEGENSAKIGRDKYLFIESDEYDSAYFEKYSKFLSYKINHLIITSLEFDHADIFSNLEQIKDQFRQLMEKVRGTVLYDLTYPATSDLVAPGGRFIGYGKDNPKILNQNSQGSTFEINWAGNKLKFQTNLVGRHNIFNLTAVILFALSEGIDPNAIQLAVQSLSLVKRRQELRGIYKGAIVYDDFAHHPTAVQTTVQAIKLKHPHQKIVAILEPQSATARSDLFQEEFAQSVKEADALVICDPLRNTTAIGRKNLDIDLVVARAKELGVKSQKAINLENLLEIIDKLADSQTVLLIMSNGTCMGLWQSPFVSKLEDSGITHNNIKSMGRSAVAADPKTQK